jgi:hypothetical protein
MKKTTLACALLSPLLLSVPGAAVAAAQYQSSLSDCRDEAVSTGLENEQDIQYYVELCMQSFGGMSGEAEVEYPDSMGEAMAEDPGVSSQ